MELWNLAIIFLALYLSLALLRRKRSRSLSLPPGPPAFPVVGNLLWLRRPFSEIESILRRLRQEYGPIVMIKVGFLTPVFVSDRDLAHKILVQSGATFAGRPPVGPATSLLTGNQYSINGLPYGPLWRALRRNLSAEILHQSRIQYFSRARDWVLTVLLDKLRMAAKSGEPVVVVDSFLYAMFCLLVFMCFGEKLEEKTVREIERVQRDILLYVDKLTIFAFLPKVGKYLLKDRWRKIGDMRRRQKDVFLPLIRARQKWRDQGMSGCGENILEFSYVDTLLDMEVPDGEGRNRKLRDEEIISLCSEFLNAGTDTTVTALQWIMANVVKRQDMGDDDIPRRKALIPAEAGCSGSWRWRPEWGASGSLIGEAAAAAALYGPAPRGPPSGREPSWFPRGSLGAAPPPPSRRRRTRSPSGRGQRGGFSPLLVKAAEDGGGPPPLALTATSDRRCLGPAARSPALLSLLPPICPPAAAAEKWAAVLGFLFQGLLSARNRALVL